MPKVLWCVVVLVVCLPAVLSQICNSDDPDSGGLFLPAFTSGGAKPESCKDGVDERCSGGKRYPENDPQPMAVLYLILLLYLFLGVSSVADKFMEGIEVITSKFVTRELVVNGKSSTVELAVWNPTVANLTLMALGSSAPEILLSIIEILGDNFYSGDLGPSTIVGSAAYNLMIISAICISALPPGETRRIKKFGVFCITAGSSVFAYLWIYIILELNTKDIVDLWEAIATFLFFPALCTIAYIADRRQSRAQVAPMTSEDARGEDLHLTQLKQDGKDVNIRPLHIAKLLKGTGAKAMTPETASEVAMHKLQQNELHSSLFFRIHGTRKLMGRHGVAASLPKIDETSTHGVTKFGFAATKIRVLESKQEVEVTVTRTGTLMPATVQYATEAGTAGSSDFKAKSGTLTFAEGVDAQKISIQIIDDDVVEDDEIFFIVLSNPRVQGPGSAELENERCTITILSDDGPGTIEWTPTAEKTELTAEYTVLESCRSVNIKLHRINGCTGKVSVRVATKDGTAVAGTDYSGIDQVVEFNDGELEKDVTIDILDDERFEKDEHFTITLAEPTGGAQIGGICIARVVVKNDDRLTELVEAVSHLLAINLDKYKIGTSTWKEQIAAVFERPPSSASVFEKALYWISLPWSMLFSLIPPTKLFGGWACFIVALAFIGLVTALIGDIASLLGCSIGMKDSVTAITFVAMGTSLPDTFASRTAAMNDRTADAAIGNVTGSNSVNVFLGLGLPWLVAACYWHYNFDSNRVEWGKKYPDLAKAGKAGFAVPAGGLGFTVAIFTAMACVCIVILVIRRFYFTGELGGKFTRSTSALFALMWVTYLVLSILKIYDKL